MGNAEANDKFVKEFLAGKVAAIRKFFDATEDHWRRKTFSTNERVLKSVKPAREAIEELEKFIEESYDPN